MKIKKETKVFGKTFSLNRRFIVSSVLCLFALIYLLFGLQTVSSGSRLAVLETEADKLRRENKELTLQLIETSSLTKLDEEAANMGFMEPRETVYLSQRESVAKLP